MNSIILMGIKHCGKSTQGRIINSITGMPFYDTDDVIKEMTGRTPREIFSADGEQAFKDAETEACRNVVKRVLESGKDCVIATGGGICNNHDALTVLHTVGTFVFLQVLEETAAARIVKEADFSDPQNIKNLPAYIAKKNPRSEKEVRDIFHDFFEERTRLYTGIADSCVSLAEMNKTANARKILRVCKITEQ